MKLQVVLSVLAIAAVFSLKAERAEARDSAALNQALQDSYTERADLEKDYRANLKSEHAAQRKSQPQSISLELGDELGSNTHGHDSGVKSRPLAKSYQEQAVSKKLDREWRDVKRSVGDTKKLSPDKAQSKESVF